MYNREVNSKKIIEQVKAEYSGKTVICRPSEDNPEEIIIEIEPTGEHPERSLALAIVGKSEPHYHIKSTEIYEVTKGTLILFIENEKFVLGVGDKKTIKPNQVHYVEGNNTWFLTHSTPGWTFEDHILV